MQKFILYLFLFCFTENLSAQLIPENRLGNWSNAGAKQPDRADFQTINVAGFGLTGDSTQVISDELNQLIIDAADQPTLFYFPEGTYVFEKPIRLTSNKILKGDSSGLSEFKFIDFEDDLIEVFGQKILDTFLVENAHRKGSFKITLNRAHDFELGDFVYLFQNDTAKVFSSWAKNSTGHLTTVRSVNGNSIFVEEPLNGHFDDVFQPKLIAINPIENVGIECLKITPTVETSKLKSNIFFKYARNCWVSGIESILTNFSHVRTNYGANISVSGSYFQDGFSYGNGGKAYGVTLGFTSTRCLIENNVFNHLRHSILLQAGANNNVMSYNYSKDPHWRGVSLPFGSAGELVLHGNHTFANLFEGNIVQNMASDDSHSSNGPFNTFFRNRTEGYGLTNGLAPPSDSQNVVGNLIIQSPDPFVPALFVLPGDGHFLAGNFYNGAIRPTGTGDLADSSLYLTQLPDFLLEVPGWALIGGSDGMNTGFNPARLRYEIYNSTTHCGWAGVPPDTTSSVKSQNKLSLEIFPNPSNDGWLHLSYPSSEILQLKVFSSLGKTVFDTSDVNSNQPIDLSFLPKGIYFLHFREKNRDVTMKWIRA